MAWAGLALLLAACGGGSTRPVLHERGLAADGGWRLSARVLFEYDPLDRRSAETRTADPDHRASSSRVRFEYDREDLGPSRVVDERLQDGAAIVTADQLLSYDDSGRLRALVSRVPGQSEGWLATRDEHRSYREDGLLEETDVSSPEDPESFRILTRLIYDGAGRKEGRLTETFVAGGDVRDEMENLQYEAGQLMSATTMARTADREWKPERRVEYERDAQGRITRQRELSWYDGDWNLQAEQVIDRPDPLIEERIHFLRKGSELVAVRRDLIVSEWGEDRSLLP